MNSWLTHLGDYSIYLYFPSVSQKRQLDSVQSRFVPEWITARYWGNCKLNSASETIKTSFQKWRNGRWEVWVIATVFIWAEPKQAGSCIHPSEDSSQSGIRPLEGFSVSFLQEAGSILTANNLSHRTRPRLKNNSWNLRRAWQIEGCEAGGGRKDHQGF